MKRTLCTVFSLLLLLLLFPSTYALGETVTSFSDDPKAIQAASNSVVMLSCYDQDGNLFATGSAFAAFEEGAFVTNYHVIEGAYSIKAQMETGLEFKISSILAFDAKKDIAILHTDAKTGLDSLPLGESSALERAEKVIAIGSPLGLINTISIGLYSGTVEDEHIYLQFSAPISEGSSGGALFNNHGEVVGITSASFTKGQNLNLAVPIEEVIMLYKSTDKSMAQSLATFYETAPTSSETTDIVSEDLRKFVDALNEEELAQRTNDDPSVGIFECGSDKNTIYYQFAMKSFKYVFESARNGDPESLNAYYQLLDSLPALESSLEKALRESMPEIKCKVILMVDSTSSNVAAIVEGGKIIYDTIDGKGTIPVGITPIEH